MYDVIRRTERNDENHHQRHHHHQHFRQSYNFNHITYHPTSFRRIDPHQAYSLYGLYASDAAFTDNVAVLPATGLCGSNYSPVSPGTAAWTEYIPAQPPKWSKPMIIDTGNQWNQRQYGGCPMVAEVSGAYRHGPVTSNTLTPPVTCGSSAASRLSRCSSAGISRSSVTASLERHQHYVTSGAQSSVTAADDDDVTPRSCAPASPQSATYQLNPTDAASNISCVVHKYARVRVCILHPFIPNVSSRL